MRGMHIRWKRLNYTHINVRGVVTYVSSTCNMGWDSTNPRAAFGPWTENKGLNLVHTGSFTLVECCSCKVNSVTVHAFPCKCFSIFLFINTSFILEFIACMHFFCTYICCIQILSSVLPFCTLTFNFLYVPCYCDVFLLYVLYVWGAHFIGCRQMVWELGYY